MRHFLFPGVFLSLAVVALTSITQAAPGDYDINKGIAEQNRWRENMLDRSMRYSAPSAPLVFDWSDHTADKYKKAPVYVPPPPEAKDEVDPYVRVWTDNFHYHYERSSKVLASQGNQFQQLLNLANGGDVTRMLNVAQDYYFGRNGAAKNIDNAFTWYHKAAEGGNLLAIDWLCGFYAGYEGPKYKDDAEWRRWKKLQGEKGDTKAISDLAYSLANGNNGEKNLSEAARLWRLAAPNSPASAYRLADYLWNYAPQRDEAQALFWYRDAGERGNNLGALRYAGSLYNPPSDYITVEQSEAQREHAPEAIDYLRRVLTRNALPGVEPLSNREQDRVGTVDFDQTRTELIFMLAYTQGTQRENVPEIQKLMQSYREMGRHEKIRFAALYDDDLLDIQSPEGDKAAVATYEKYVVGIFADESESDIARCRLATHLVTGRGIERDVTRARKLYKDGLKLDFQHESEARVRYGRLLRAGLGGPIDKAEALRQFLIAGNDRFSSQDWRWIATREAGVTMLSNPELKAPDQDALLLLNNALDHGDSAAAYYLALAYDNGDVGDIGGKDRERALKYARQGAEGGHIPSMDLLARFESDEKWVPSPDGLQWLRKAADAGYATSQYWLAHLARVDKDTKQAVNWLQKAADGGDIRAMTTLADMLAEGDGVPKDTAAALKLLRQAAPQDANAASNLGVILWRGAWGEKDVATGLQWMEAALDAGFWPAGRNLAKIYHLGLDVTGNEDKARAYLEKAGNTDGIESAKAVADLYTKGEVINKDTDAAQRWLQTANELAGKDKHHVATP